MIYIATICHHIMAEQPVKCCYWLENAIDQKMYNEHV